MSYTGVRRTLQRISESAQSIGEGGDARVVVSTIEAVEGISEICYKFSKEAETPRGRNVMSRELEVHSKIYEVLSAQHDLKIGAPSPYYYCEMGGNKLIGMERLHARSIDDLLRGFGSLPEWFGEVEIDELCNQLIKAIDLLHEHNLYHRDLHKGNVMVTQASSREELGKLGYIIDFGLSGIGHEGMDPYKKETNGQVFTYADDYGRIEFFRKELKELKERTL